jgi:microcystin degradation protein MlrC
MPRVLLATILHEANTFALTPAPLSHFRRQGVFTGAEVPERLAATRTEMAGFLEAAAIRGWQVTTPIAVPCAPAGPMSREAFEHFRAVLTEGVRAAGRLDGVLLALHGACVAEHETDGDGVLARSVRELVGPDVPIVITLDPHSNVSDLLAASVNAMTAYRTHPHTDHKETGLRAAAILARCMAEGLLPVVHLARGWQMRGFDASRTSLPDGPMRRALALARQIEGDHPDAIEVSIQSGFVLADVWRVGPSVAVTGLRAALALQSAAERLMHFAWDERRSETVAMLSVSEALEAVRAVLPGPGPVVLSDFGDAPGGGGYGDATAVLAALLADPPGNTVFASIADAEAVRAATVAGVGNTLKLSLGGHTAPEHGGPPIVDDFQVLALSDGSYTHEGPYTPGLVGNFGASVLLGCRGVRIVVTSFQRNILDLQQLRIFGIDPSACGLIAIKCMDAFRAAFAPIARAVIACESGGVSSRIHTTLVYRNVRRPIWPLDPDDTVARAAGYLAETVS